VVVLFLCDESRNHAFLACKGRPRKRLGEFVSRAHMSPYCDVSDFEGMWIPR